MKNIKFLILAIVTLVASSAVFGQAEQRVKFRKGATTATVTGYLNNYKSSKSFVVRLRAGQTLKVSSNQRVTLAIADPSDADVMDRDASCNSRGEVSPTVAGDYTIFVSECLKADEWKGPFKLKITAK